ncbi:DUF4419 domain-containing protein [Aspergillus chevalieri]|uniref:DUF4419 domain-containing protein n=1 Tax=Aspergillus chevalieri TaxID=182096 RepID=A0A7R7VHA2_ASPCH|nr:uncharacterized protein ACHE_20160S [Aspergillus chevalieri]BCR84702.1 hypothetical protein ACHE_20160S [Aspergillus chevalieri]
MPVSLQTADHQAKKWTQTKQSTTEDLFKASCPNNHCASKQIIQSAFSQPLDGNHISSSKHGFVYALYHAYSHHHHLTIRPDDVWVAILNQINFYVNAHAEELRSFFVAHEGQKELTVVEAGTIRTVDLGALAVKMTNEIQKNVLDPELQKWIMPEFSTTTANDKVVAAIQMMGTMQKYFSYTVCLLCGIPSVTLLGERDDWELLLKKLDKIPQLGKEPAQFAELLTPVLKRFVACFDDPASPDLRDFWGRCAHYYSGGSGPTYLSGWVTAFCFWDEDGKPLNHGRPGEWATGCELDGVAFHRVETEDIPAGYASVPVKLNDNGMEYDTMMLAGMIGIQASSSGQLLEGASETGLDSIQPVSGWWMYEKTKESGSSVQIEEVYVTEV